MILYNNVSNRNVCVEQIFISNGGSGQLGNSEEFPASFSMVFFSAVLYVVCL